MQGCRLMLAAGVGLAGVLATTPGHAQTMSMSPTSQRQDEATVDLLQASKVLRYTSRAVRIIDQFSPMQQVVEPAVPNASTLHRVLGAADTVLAPAGIGASAMGASHAYDELQNGNTLHGSFELAGSAAGMVGSVAGTSEAFGIATSLGMTTSLAPVAAAGAGIAATLDGAKDTYEGFRDHDASRFRSGSVKSLGGSMMTAGAYTFDPVLVAGGAAVYLGGVAYENWDDIAAWWR